MLKLDLEKAFNTVDWNFLSFVLKKKKDLVVSGLDGLMIASEE